MNRIAGLRIVRAVCFVALALLAGCNHNEGGKFRSQLVAEIETKCHFPADCVIQAKPLTSFEWDKMYVFYYGGNQGKIERVIGAKLDRFDETKSRIIFTRDSSIVHYEENPVDLERVLNRDVVSDIPGADGYKVYESGAAFAVKKVDLDKHWWYYELKQVR
ncbi:MAG: hypothetical protein HYX26_03270 [Acidobacteriales bacterium]|nr:hypothetical protein [Terriglobales bacterium]